MWARDLGLALASGALLVLSFPAFDLGVLAWVALVPLLLALHGKSPSWAFLLAHAAGVVFFAGIFSWISTIRAWNVLDDLVVKGLYLPLYVSIWALALTWVRRRTGAPALLVAPPLWVASEYLRGHAAFLSLPWMLLGHSQHPYPALLQVTALTGVYGLSFLIVLANVAIAETILYLRRRSEPARAPGLRPPLLALATAGGLLVATLVYGLAVLSDGVGSERLRVALVQGNMPQEKRRDRLQLRAILDRHRDLSLRAAVEAPELIIWPETAVPGDVRHHIDLRQAVARVALETGTPLLVGSAEHAKFTDRKLAGKYYNALVLFTPGGEIAGEYRKVRLVPFGEYVPLRDHVTWPKAIVASAGDLLAGNGHTRLTVGSVSFRAVICWEIIFADLFRRAVREGAAFMVLATNEAWFGETAAPYQLLAMTAFRAAENRVAIARAANTGVSAFIDPFGRVTRRVTGPGGRELFVEGVLVGEVPLARQQTFYTRYGDVFAFLQIAATLLAFSLALAGRPLSGFRRA